MYLRDDDVDRMIAAIDNVCIKLWKLQAAVRGLREAEVKREARDTTPMVALGEGGAFLRAVQGGKGGWVKNE